MLRRSGVARGAPVDRPIWLRIIANFSSPIMDRAFQRLSARGHPRSSHFGAGGGGFASAADAPLRRSDIGEECQNPTLKRQVWRSSARATPGTGSEPRSPRPCVWNCPSSEQCLKKFDQGFALDPRGKEVKIQGVSVLPTRKPKWLPRSSVVYPTRPAERRNCGSLIQEPPRTTWRSALPPCSQAEPSDGAPL